MNHPATDVHGHWDPQALSTPRVRDDPEAGLLELVGLRSLVGLWPGYRPWFRLGPRGFYDYHHRGWRGW